MKSIRSNPISENKTNEISIADLSRVKLPRLQKPIKKIKKPLGNISSRIDPIPSKYDQLVEELIDLQTCVSKKYGKSVKVDCLKKLQKSISSLNQDSIRHNGRQSAKEPAIRSTSSSETGELMTPGVNKLNKWSKQLQFKRRLEMENKNLIVINFEGVIGDIFKDNIWQDQKEKLHIRKDAIKGLRELLYHFQVVLFFHSPTINYDKILKYFAKKSVVFDGVYASENSNQWLSKSQGRFKKSLKYSEHVQNYSQISNDFGILHEALGKMLIVTSIWLDHDEHFTAGLNLIIKNFNCIPQYLW